MTQEKAFKIMTSESNVFLTGPAGAGKTFLLNRYIDYLKKHNVIHGITASTGIATTHLNGRTIHSWCGMRIEERMTDSQIKTLRRNERIQDRIQPAEVLIIDEISMLNASRLDLVDKICKAFKNNSLPFGGIKVVLCGDFFQLPPVVTTSGEDNRFIIESDIWQRMDIKVCYLEEQHRQEDRNLLCILNDIRKNSVDLLELFFLRQRLNKPIESKIKPTKLHTHNSSVDAENQLELSKLKDKEHEFQMNSGGNERLIKDLKKWCLAPEQLVLKKKAVVMFLKNNFERGYVNGTLGIVKGFDKDSGYPVVETIHGNEVLAYPEKWTIEENNKVLAFISQVPLRLAWAITVHKSQGMSLDCAEIDLSKTFEYGMGYVALSRVRSLAGIKLLGLNEMALKVSDKVIEIDKKLRSQCIADRKTILCDSVIVSEA